MIQDEGSPSPAVPDRSARSLPIADLIRAAEKLKAAGEGAAADALYEGWILVNPDSPLLYAVLFNASVIQSEIGDLTGAQASLERAIALNADFMPAYINLGRIHERLGQPQAALTCWSTGADRLSQVNGTAITYKTTALNQMARMLEGSSQDSAAEVILLQSLDIDPTQREVAQHYLALRQRQCEWPVIVPTDRVTRRTLMTGLSPLSVGAYTDDPLFQLALAAHYNRLDVGTPAEVHSAWPKASDRGGPLRIGYLSSDLREHAVGHLMADVFGLHDRSKVEIFAYYCGPAANDPLAQRYRAEADHWIDITTMDDASAARRMVDDGIQILVDVNGYTREGRTKLLALRPAPVIVNWLGYPGTLGSPHHHYIVADDWIIPPENEIYYSEKVVRLPCYQPNDSHRTVAEPRPTREEAGLPADAMVFCCFNGLHKITRFTFERWLTILKGVPDSVLWLLSGGEEPEKRLRDFAAAFGVDPARIVFAPKKSNPEHLARYPLADLCIDSTPYGAHTTASDALYMGVPMLTLSGRSFASRVCGSLVRSAGLAELVTTRAEEFISKAIELGRDKAKLAALRKRLSNKRKGAVLFDMPLLVRSLEALYAGMWSDLEAGRLPRPDLAGLELCLDLGCAFDHEATEVQSIEDYEGWWREMAKAYHRLRTVTPDKRLFKDAESWSL